MAKKTTRGNSQAPQASRRSPDIEDIDDSAPASPSQQIRSGDEADEEPNPSAAVTSQTIFETQEQDAQVLPSTIEPSPTVLATEQSSAPSGGNEDQYRNDVGSPELTPGDTLQEIEDEIEAIQRKALLIEAKARRAAVTLRLEAAEEALTNRGKGLLVAQETSGPTAHHHSSEPRPAPPKIEDYHGRTIRDETLFIRACEIQHSLMPSYFANDTKKILTAMPYLKGKVADAWHRTLRTRDVGTWSWVEWDEWLKDQIDGKDTRADLTAHKLKLAQQGPRQDPLDLLTYIETLEIDLPPTSEELKLQNFWTALNPDLARSMKMTGQVWTTRSQCVDLAQRLYHASLPRNNGKTGRDRFTRSNPEEGDHKRQDRRHSNRSHPDSAPNGSGPRTYSGPPRNENGPAAGVNAMPPRDAANIICHECKKKGHFARNCPQKRQIATVTQEAKNEDASRA